MTISNLTLKEADRILSGGFPKLTEKQKRDLKNSRGNINMVPSTIKNFLEQFPFSEYLIKVWVTDDRYPEHGPKVLEAMNQLLSNPANIYKKSKANSNQLNNLIEAVAVMIRTIGGSKISNILLRFAALYHDIGKSIIKERHPVIGWYIAQYIKPEDRDKLRELFGDEDDVRLLMAIIRDHDQFGILSTGEASIPILQSAINFGASQDDRKRILSALAMCNLADMVGTFDVDGEATDRLLGDWRWFMGALDHCTDTGDRLDEYLVHQASRIRSATQTPWEAKLLTNYPYVAIPNVTERVRRLLMEASRQLPTRRKEFNDEQLIATCLQTVFGSENGMREFAHQFTYVCKLDYGKRFFQEMINYCTNSMAKPMSKNDIIYAVFAVLKRITVTYSSMIRSSDNLGNLIGVELKDLTPDNAPEKTQRIVELIVSSHYPGLTWMMSDAPAWYF